MRLHATTAGDTDKWDEKGGRSTAVVHPNQPILGEAFHKLVVGDLIVAVLVKEQEQLFTKDSRQVEVSKEGRLVDRVVG